MLKNTKKRIICSAFALVLLTGCGSVPVDKSVVNFNMEHQVVSLSSIDVYFDGSVNLSKSAKSECFSPIVYSAYSALNDMSLQKDTECKINLINNDITEIDSDQFSRIIGDATGFSGEGSNILKSALNNLSDGTLSVIITGLNGQLGDYSGLSSAIVDNVLAKKLAVGIIGIETETEPFFIIAVGDNDNLSEFITKFKEKPDVIALNGEQELLQMDITRKINYEIFANNNGIMGMNYNGISVVENGEIYQVVKSDNPDGTVNIDTNVLYESKGSFDTVNEEYTPDLLNTIEGTVNFKDISDANRKIVTLKPPKNMEITDDDGNTEKIPVSPNDLNYVAVQSLVKDEEDGLAGKLKLEIPFNVINGVRLSDLECDVVPTLYITDGDKFREYDGSIFDYMDVNLAEGAIEEQGKWRVINERNSVICNVKFPNAASFPKTNGLVKLDINFKQYKAKGDIPKWVNDWSNSGVNNLNNLFNSLYEYQSSRNASENTMTLYIAKNTNKK